jgi:hypothetical protein
MFDRMTLAHLGLSFITGAAVLSGALSAGCSDDNGGAAPDTSSGPLVIEEGCQPLLARTKVDEASRGTCLLPYPSDFYRETTGGTPRIVLHGAAKPQRVTGGNADLHDVVAMDGASLIPSIVATLPSRVVHDGLPGVLDDPTKSATASSATVIIDAETGAFVPHYTDKIDRGVDDEHEPIVLRTFSPLSPKRRYIVALKGVRLAPAEGEAADSSKVAPPPEGFRRLRDGAVAADPALGAIKDRFDREVFGPLERAGVARKDLQLAWDFTTGSEEQPRADMLRVRDLALAWLGANTPQVTITESKPGSDRIWRTVTGTITGPLFLDQPGPAGRLFRGADGLVTQNGTTTFDFTINVPNSVRDRFEPGRALAYGHGFFGGRTELEGNGAKTIAEQLGAVELGIDWWGMSREDVGRVSTTLGDDPPHGADFTERVHQAMANWIIATAAFRGPLAQAPELMRPAEGAGVVMGPGGTSNAGQLVYDPSFVGYFGASQGHILGGTLAALDPDFTRAVLNVGGGGFSHMMPRSSNFGPFSIVLDVTFKDALMVQAYIAMFQRALDRIDPVTYAPLVGTPERRVLLQIGLGDAQVPNAGSFLHARALGVKQTMPAPQNVFGLEPATDPTASALTLFDFGIDTSAYATPSPLPENAVHEGVRVNAKALRQMAEFLRPGGTIVHPCDGPCDPE